MAKKSCSKPARAPRRVLAERTTMMPHHTNGMGNIFGGVLLQYMDLAGAYVARRACKRSFIPMMVTRFMNQVEFKKPVHVNDVISCYGTVIKIGTTSITVKVEVFADRAKKKIPVTSCEMVFVALDPRDGKPTSVLSAGCESTEEKPAAEPKKPATNQKKPAAKRRTR